MEAAALVAVALLAGISLFQIALALGAPLGRAAWGGQHPGVLPTSLRTASGVAGIVVYPLLIVLVLASAGLVSQVAMPGAGKVAVLLIAGYFALGAVMNTVSRSKAERVWGPVSLVIAVCCALVAFAL